MGCRSEDELEEVWNQSYENHIQSLDHDHMLGFLSDPENPYMISDYCSRFFEKLVWGSDASNHALCQCFDDTAMHTLDQFKCGITGMRLKSLFEIKNTCSQGNFFYIFFQMSTFQI